MLTAEEVFDSLHPLEVKVLAALAECGAAAQATDRELIARGVTSEDHIRTVVEWQLAKGGIAVVGKEIQEFAALAEEGERYAKDGVPELLLLQRLEKDGALAIAELRATAGVDAADAGSAVGALKKAGLLADAGDGKVLVAADSQKQRAPFAALAAALAQVRAAGRLALAELDTEIAEAVRAASRKRSKAKGVFRIEEVATRTLALTPLGRAVAARIKASGLSGNEESNLTQAMLKDGSWRQHSFRRYNIKLSPPRHVTGKRNPYLGFLDLVKRKLLGLGFEEMRGPLVETEFWNMDALFMPQFHPARAIHDVYNIVEPTHARELPEPHASRVAAAHRDGGGTGSTGWRYEFDRERTARLVLRSQGTALSARWLHKARIPGKYFAIARCFRFDQVDATHAPDFFQIEGIVSGREINFRELLGLLQVFAREVARAEEIRYVPAYFPFTEPSVEVHMRHPRIGWMELGGAGIFRPEVTIPGGVPPEVPVIAWGLGLDRMAMVALGIDDIRDLFTSDLNFLRSRQAPLET